MIYSATVSIPGNLLSSSIWHCLCSLSISFKNDRTVEYCPARTLSWMVLGSTSRTTLTNRPRCPPHCPRRQPCSGRQGSSGNSPSFSSPALHSSGHCYAPVHFCPSPKPCGPLTYPPSPHFKKTHTLPRLSSSQLLVPLLLSLRPPSARVRPRLSSSQQLVPLLNTTKLFCFAFVLL